MGKFVREVQDSLISNLETPAFGFQKKLIIAKNTGLFKKEKKSTNKAKTEKKKSKQENENMPIQEKIANYLKQNQK